MGGSPSPPVVVPALSPGAEAGRAAFARGCAACHGAYAEGTASGPPLVHPIYRPNHHADEAFWLAVRRGVRAHHWRFGDMPALPQVDAEETRRIVLYVRELQRANGIN